MIAFARTGDVNRAALAGLIDIGRGGAAAGAARSAAALTGRGGRRARADKPAADIAGFTVFRPDFVPGALRCFNGIGHVQLRSALERGDDIRAGRRLFADVGGAAGYVRRNFRAVYDNFFRTGRRKACRLENFSVPAEK